MGVDLAGSRFDTKTPEKFGSLELEMEFQPLELEFNLENFPDARSHFGSSNKLRFIIPESLNVYIITDDNISALQTRFDNGELGSDAKFTNVFKKALKAA